MPRNTERADAWLQVAEALAAHPRGRADRTGLMVFSLLAVATLSLAVLSFIGGIGLDAEESQQIGLIGSGFLGTGLLMTALAFHQWRSLKRGRALRASFLQLVDNHRGQIADGRDVAQWLGRHWDGEYQQRSLATTEEIFRATLHIERTPVLIDLTPTSYKTGTGETATWSWWAQAVAPTSRQLTGVRLNPEHPLVRQIESRGYGPECDAGGLVARGSVDLEKSFGKRPERVFEIFEVATELAQLVKVVEAEGSAGLPSSVPATLPWSGEQSPAATRRQAARQSADRKRVVFLGVAVIIIIAASTILHFATSA